MVLALVLLAGTAVVATHPQVLRNLAVIPCDHYVLVSAHAAHPQQDSLGGVTVKIGYGFTYRPWGTVKYVKVLPNSADVKEVVFVLNKTGLMKYFDLFEDWKPKDIALIIKVNGRSLGFEFAYLHPDGSITGYKNPNVRIEGNEIHVKVFGWRREPCDLKISFEPAIEFYNGIAPVNWLGLPGAVARLKCASCTIGNTPMPTYTIVPNAHLAYIWVDSVSPWHPEVGQTVTVEYGISLNRPASVDFHAVVFLAVNSKSNIVKRVDITIPKGREEYRGTLTFVAKEGDWRIYVGASAYGKTIWSREHQIITWSVGTEILPSTPTGAPAAPTQTASSVTQPVTTTQAVQSPAAQSTQHPPSVIDRIVSAVNAFISQLSEWISRFRWPW